MKSRNDEVAEGARHAKIKRVVWFACIWSWPVCVVGFVISFAFIARLIPPPPPSWSAQEIASFFAGNCTRIRIGTIGALYFSALLMPYYTAVSAEMKKIEGSSALLAPLQFAGAVVLVTFFQIIGLAWLLATYRPEISPEMIRMLNDYCWFVWSMLIPTYIFQYVCMAIAGFMDMRPQPAWPRWAAYLNLWVAFTGAGGFFAVFVKGGAFAWNGMIGFWIPLIVFALGNFVTVYLLHRRHKIDAPAEAAAV